MSVSLVLGTKLLDTVLKDIPFSQIKSKSTTPYIKIILMNGDKIIARDNLTANSLRGLAVDTYYCSRETYLEHADKIHDNLKGSPDSKVVILS